MNSSDSKQLNTQIYDEASEWFVEFRTGELDLAARRRFNAWLRTSPEHMRAYLELAAIWNEGSRLDPSHKFDTVELIDDVDNVVPLKVPVTMAPGTAVSGASGLSREGTSRKNASQARWYCTLAASLLFAVVGTWTYVQRGLYSTDIGEQRSITLADGSRIELNARSQLRVRFTNHTREIELLEGQALFEVAKDKARPFIVRSANTQVRAVGTQFDVYRRPTGTTVTVVEGRVAVSPSFLPKQESSEVNHGSAEPIEAHTGEFLLAAGEQVLLTAQATVKPDKPNIAAATAWTQNRLVFESATLNEVADEFNRYNHRRLIIDCDCLSDFHITGTFSSSDPASLLRFLQSRPGIIVTQDKEEIRISRQETPRTL